MKKINGSWCPMSRRACRGDCAWMAEGGCAVLQIAQQSKRQGDELFYMAEVMAPGNPGDPQPQKEDNQARTGG